VTGEFRLVTVRALYYGFIVLNDFPLSQVDSLNQTTGSQTSGIVLLPGIALLGQYRGIVRG
jgi:hypothetical protein